MSIFSKGLSVTGVEFLVTVIPAGLSLSKLVGSLKTLAPTSTSDLLAGLRRLPAMFLVANSAAWPAVVQDLHTLGVAYILRESTGSLERFQDSDTRVGCQHALIGALFMARPDNDVLVQPPRPSRVAKNVRIPRTCLQPGGRSDI
jgi:hypothetical protein